jgi:hypothetical protein
MNDLETKAKELFEKESLQYETLPWDSLSPETHMWYMRRAHHLDLIVRLRKRAEIRRQIPRGEPDRIADLLEEAANAIEGTDDY